MNDLDQRLTARDRLDAMFFDMDVRGARRRMNMHRKHMREWYEMYNEPNVCRDSKRRRLRLAQQEKRKMIKDVIALTDLLYPNGIARTPVQLQLPL